MVFDYINDLRTVDPSEWDDYRELDKIKSALICALAGNYYKGDQAAADALVKVLGKCHRHYHRKDTLIDSGNHVIKELQAHGTDALDDYTVRQDIYTLIAYMY